MEEPANRTAFFVDGFNLYHSVCEAEKDTDERPLKWLDIAAMCESTLHLIGKTARFAGVHYFSAYADHLSEQAPDKVQRHKIFVRALTATRRVKVHLGHFRKRDTFIKELAQLCPESFTLSLKTYLEHQFPERIRLPSKKYVVMPPSWGTQPPA
ncbi:hypothetical protein H5P28_09045 [Ruficoccus amylovorans]|uniref:NYN domain-containing protein n=1 Tax=Ruficoccus amylovorans TaxID=1804625 RepID=A0A842HGM8_9BACT|nr:hypothetical protein [Ruficoccus amylovorans]MBC2594401.1 hypothetical protein [Ruficoccus amylovorans]